MAVHSTTVVPSPNVLPGVGMQLTTGSGSTISLATGSGYATTVPEGLSIGTVMLAGWPNVGGVLSSTVTV